MASFTISTCDEHSAIDYAAQELARCLTTAGLSARREPEGDFRLGLIGSLRVGSTRGIFPRACGIGYST